MVKYGYNLCKLSISLSNESKSKSKYKYKSESESESESGSKYPDFSAQPHKIVVFVLHIKQMASPRILTLDA